MEKISIVGVGKLGLCLALNLEDSGYEILGCDVNNDYIESLNNKSFRSNEKGVDGLLLKSKNFRATTKIEEAIGFSNIIFVMVATPSLDNGKYDCSQIESLITQLESVGRQQEKKLFIIGCTTFPGYCESIESRLNNLNYEVLYNPEFIAQGNILYGQKNPDIVLIGSGDLSDGIVVEKIHSKLCSNKPVYCHMSLTEAELTKLSINCFITTKISFANMIGDICHKVGISEETVLNAIGKDSRIGEKYLKWGYGFGGPCFPRDNRALGVLCYENGIEPSIPAASDEYNKLHLDYQVDFMLNNNNNSDEFHIDGISYKKGSNLIVESQQLQVALRLAEAGKKVIVQDQEIVINEVRSLYGDKFEYVEAGS